MFRPKLKLELKPLDKVIERMSMSLLIFSFMTPIYFYSKLPDIIPTHFNGSGEVDGHGDKIMLFLLPVLAAALYAGLRYLNKFPHIFNIPIKITEENAASEYRKITRMIRFINLSIVGMFFYINFIIAQIALGNTDGLGSNFSLLFAILIFVPIVVYLASALKKFK